MDHTTCLAFKIGIKRNTQKNKSEQKIITNTSTDKPPNEKEKKEIDYHSLLQNDLNVLDDKKENDHLIA